MPSQFATIQSAINAASPGDVVLVALGTYVENLDFLAKNLTLTSESGSFQTIIDGGQSGRVIDISAGGTVEGFTIRNGFVPGVGGGIRVRGLGQTLIRNCLIEANQAGYPDVGVGGGVAFPDPGSQIVFTSNVVRGNYGGDEGGGIYSRAFSATIQDNVIEDNGCHVCGAGMSIAFDAVVIGNLVRRNLADSFGAGLCLGFGAARIENNTIYGNINRNNFVSGAGIHIADGSPKITRNVIAANRSGAGIKCASSRSPVIECNDSWNNEFGDYLLSGNCDTTGGKNISADPLFCDVSSGDFHIAAQSPASDTAPSGCGLLGAFPVACGATPTRESTWGRLRARYR